MALKAMASRLGRLPHRMAFADAGDAAGQSRSRDARQPWRSWYKTADWQRLRKQCLERDGWVCQKTGVVLSGKYPASNSPVADHIKPHRGDPNLFWDLGNLQAVSKQYHDSEKQRLERNQS